MRELENMFVLHPCRRACARAQARQNADHGQKRARFCRQPGADPDDQIFRNGIDHADRWTGLAARRVGCGERGAPVRV